MPLNETKKIRLLRLVNEIFTSLLLIGIVVVIYYLVSHFTDLRMDLTRSGRFSLSDTSVKLLDKIKKQNQKITVTVFYKDHPPAQERLMRARVYDLLKEYHQRSGKTISLPQIINPDKRPDEVKRLGIRFPGTIVLEFEHEKQNENHLGTRYLIIPHELWGVRMVDGRPGPEEFKAENAISGALKKMMDGRRRILYFVQGHDEPFLRLKEPRGLSEWADKLEVANFSIQPLYLSQKEAIPTNTDVVIICGPKNTYLPQELDALLSYAKNGGRLLILAEFNTQVGLDPLFAFLGIELGNDLVIDSKSYQGNLIAPLPDYGEHPIVRDLRALSEPTLLTTVRTVERALGDTRGIITKDLLLSSRQAWAEKNYLNSKEAKFEEGSGDRKGPVTMAMAIVRPAETDDKKETRAVVFGDADFATNEMIVFGSNQDLLLNSVNWLVDAEDSIGISPKNPEFYLITMSIFQIWIVFWIVVLILPGIVLCFGIMQWWHRRSL